MDQERWRHIEELFHAALDREGNARADFLNNACPDSELRHEVLALLDQSHDGLLDRPAAALVDGAMLGPYQIQGLIGSGGMGAVYKAIDTRLNRTVAIKFSIARFSTRFEREARAIAALNHPHVCALYDVGPNYLVMEYVEGETLAARLAKGPLRSEQAIQYAVEIAGALAFAHRQRILHRDLKPANIMLSKRGTKLVDFGLAKMEGRDSASGTATLTGAILGTMQYMSPEQLEGKDADIRSEIYSFGAVLYEMVTGSKAHGRSAPASKEVMPQSLARLVEACMAKDPDERLQNMADVAQDLRWLADPAPVDAPLRRGKQTAIWIAAAALIALGTLIAFAAIPSKSANSVRLVILPAEGTTIVQSGSLAISPDGAKVAFIAVSEGKRRLWVRPLASETPRVLSGTEGALLPFWSADSQKIGYFTGSGQDAKLKAVPASGGPPQTICNSGSSDGAGGRSGGASWNRDGTVLFAVGGPVFRVPAGGGDPRPVTQLDEKSGETSHSMPEFLPDGQHFLFWSNNRDYGKQAIWVGSLNSPGRVMVMPSETMPRFAEPDYILFSRDGSLFAQRLDLKRFRLIGKAVALAEEVSGVRPLFSASSNGVLVYLHLPAIRLSPGQLAWYNRDGKRLEGVGGPRSYAALSISPDGKRVAVVLDTGVPPKVARSSMPAPGNTGSGRNIYLLDLQSGVFSRLTFGDRYDSDPVWSPDSRRIVYLDHDTYTQIPSETAVRWMELTIGEQAPKLIWEDKARIGLDAWSPDGRFLLFRRNDRTILSLPMQDQRKPETVFEAASMLDEERISADGRWMAYNSSESGQWQVYVAAFPSMTRKRQISTEGGCVPFWRKDGRELFYATPQGKIMSVAVRLGAELEASAPTLLFQAPRQFNCQIAQYGVAASGQRFLIIEPLADPQNLQPMHVVLNWDAEVGR